MKRKISLLLVIVLVMSLMAACGDDDESQAGNSSIVEHISPEDMPPRPSQQQAQASVEPAAPVVVEEPALKVPEGEYLSELTGEPLKEELKDQRPIAVMVDNEKIALPHFGTAEGDVVYEMMNSTANDRITRLMIIMKDWGSITQMGSIRSTRPTNIILAAEWNAVLCHDGGPYHNDAYFAKSWAPDHFSGTFGRVNNGKSREFTEYILSGDLDKNFSSSKASRTYNQLRPSDETHFNFIEWGKYVHLNEIYDDAFEARNISLPFKHNQSKLAYHESSKSYDYYEYGSAHRDGEDDEIMTFENVILQACDFSQLDQNGYLVYNCIALVQPAYYITNGYAKLIYWSKSSETDLTRYYDENNQEIQINTGKTYIGLIPMDTWQQVAITG